MRLKSISFFLFFVSIFMVKIHAVEDIVLKIEEDYLEKLLKNDVFIKHAWDIESYEGCLYFLDSHHCVIFQVDFKTGKLIKTFFSRGQGPYELMQPIAFKVKNEKIFVLDKGFGGIKIADFNQKQINEFKTKTIIGKKNVDVNDNDEIYIGEYNSKEKTFVSVYNIQGKKIRSWVKIPSLEKPSLKHIKYLIQLDSEDNIFLMFIITQELLKFSKNGELIWKKEIENKVLDKFPHGEISRNKKNKTISSTESLFDLGIIGDNNALIGHAGGGCLYDKNGNLTKLLTIEEDGNIDSFAVVGDKLINCALVGRIIQQYSIKEILER